MSNRFVRKIKSGEIASIDELKAEFKELAKRTHPDLAGPGADHADFAAMRDEYEKAFRGFAEHRFGAREAADPGRGGKDAGPIGDALAADAWASLSVLMARDFPKQPRHEKEKLRYEYARWRFEQAIKPGLRQAFADCEAELLGMRSSGSAALEAVLGFILLLIDYRASGLSAMRTEIVLALSALRRDPRIGPGCRELVLALALDLGVGGEIGPAT